MTSDLINRLESLQPSVVDSLDTVELMCSQLESSLHSVLDEQPFACAIVRSLMAW